MNVRRLRDRSGYDVLCEVAQDGRYSLTWPDGTVARGESHNPWDAILRLLDQPHYSLVQQAMMSVCLRKSA